MKAIYSFITVLMLSLFVSSCGSEIELNEEVGYLKLDVTTLTSTYTRAAAPADYDAKTLAVQILDASNNVVMSTDDVANDDAFKGNITLTPGTYTIKASSAGWDGSGSGFDTPYYMGSTTATVEAKTLTQANVTLTQANVKVTVKFDDSFSTYFNSANCTVSSAVSGVSSQVFNLTTTGSAYFPVGDLTFLLEATNKAGQSNSMSETVTDVQARDHYIINYKIADAGSMGGVTVSVDDEKQTYTFNIEVSRKSSTALQANPVAPWSTFADLSGAITAKTASFDVSKMTLQYKKSSDADWTEIASSALASAATDSYSYRLKNLQPATEYVYRLSYNDGATSVNSNEVNFTTESQMQIENAGFENWYKDGKSWIPGTSGSNYWASSNPGSTSMGEKYNVTTQATDFFHSGTSSAKLASQYVVIKLAAASLFTGKFLGLIGTNGAKLDWGVPFTSRPSALKGYLSYTTAAITRGTKPTNVGAYDKNANDACQIFCALLTEQLHVGGNASTTDNGVKYEESTKINWENDKRVIAYGQITRDENTPAGTWENFSIPLTYHTLTEQPKYMLIVCSSNKWGDYFYGSDKAVLYVDDFSFEYGEPTVK